MHTDSNTTPLAEFITTYKFVAFTALLSDALAIVTDLSKKFQTESMDGSAVSAHINVAMAALQGMKAESTAERGTHLSEFYLSLVETDVCNEDGSKIVSTYHKGVKLECSDISEVEFLSLKDCFLESVIEGLEERLCNDSTAVLNAFSLLEPQMARSVTREEKEKLLNLLDAHFKSKNASHTDEYNHVNVPALRTELGRLTPLFSGCYAGLRFEGLARMLIIRHQNDYPQACKLAEIGLTLPVSTASCERGFSLQNRIKVKSRTRLLPENLEMLMKLALVPDLEHFPLGNAVSHWYSERRRRIARLYQPYHGRHARCLLAKRCSPRTHGLPR